MLITALILFFSTLAKADDPEDVKAMEEFLRALRHQGENPDALREFFEGLGEGFQHLADKVVGT